MRLFDILEPRWIVLLGCMLLLVGLAWNATYRANRICLMGEPEGPVAAILRHYPKDGIVTVCYNPNDPNDCILERAEPAKIREAWLGAAVLSAWILEGSSS